MDEQKPGTGPEPRFERGHFLLVAGFSQRFVPASAQAISQLWQRFIPHVGKVPGQINDVTYGVHSNPDGQGGFEYIAGVEISKLDDLPEHYRWIEMQSQHYAVFEHGGSLQDLPRTFDYIWRTWLPQSARQAADEPSFERYSADFNPDTGTGVVEIWLPLKAA
ncbi:MULTISPECIES: GyrI-like domain-containing protein [unclassified Pseudomonas]|uniref:GyrI-like domain-containing protein n=1 Tax=unclassified Pseudomonas TaxID=196821 RepID=UPI0008384284|nr:MULTISPECIES: GyrI-like domain-containing protein [unclassified Pseudomonas]QIH10239.1 AraC family transcriptional regulator [Pseudomonas sp. BIOMIG1BAC]